MQILLGNVARDLASWLPALRLNVPDQQLSARESLQNLTCAITSVGNFSAGTAAANLSLLMTGFGASCDGELVRHGIQGDTTRNESISIDVPRFEAVIAIADPVRAWLPSCYLDGSVAVSTVPERALSGSALCDRMELLVNETLTPLLVSLAGALPSTPPPLPPMPPPSPPSPLRSPEPGGGLIDWTKSHAFAVAASVLDQYGAPFVDRIVDRLTNGTGTLHILLSLEAALLDPSTLVAPLVGASNGTSPLLNVSVQLQALHLAGLDSILSLSLKAPDTAHPQSLHVGIEAQSLRLGATVSILAAPTGAFVSGFGGGATDAMGLYGPALEETFEITLEMVNASMDVSMLWGLDAAGIASLQAAYADGSASSSSSAALLGCIQAATVEVNLTAIRAGFGRAPGIGIVRVAAPGSDEKQLGTMLNQTQRWLEDAFGPNVAADLAMVALNNAVKPRLELALQAALLNQSAVCELPSPAAPQPAFSKKEEVSYAVGGALYALVATLVMARFLQQRRTKQRAAANRLLDALHAADNRLLDALLDAQSPRLERRAQRAEPSPTAYYEVTPSGTSLPLVGHRCQAEEPAWAALADHSDLAIRLLVPLLLAIQAVLSAQLALGSVWSSTKLVLGPSRELPLYESTFWDNVKQFWDSQDEATAVLLVMASAVQPVVKIGIMSAAWWLPLPPYLRNRAITMQELTAKYSMVAAYVNAYLLIVFSLSLRLPPSPRRFEAAIALEPNAAEPIAEIVTDVLPGEVLFVYAQIIAQATITLLRVLHDRAAASQPSSTAAAEAEAEAAARTANLAAIDVDSWFPAARTPSTSAVVSGKPRALRIPSCSTVIGVACGAVASAASLSMVVHGGKLYGVELSSVSFEYTGLLAPWIDASGPEWTMGANGSLTSAYALGELPSLVRERVLNDDAVRDNLVFWTWALPIVTPAATIALSLILALLWGQAAAAGGRRRARAGGRTHRLIGLVHRALQLLAPWSFLEVYALGVLVLVPDVRTVAHFVFDENRCPAAISTDLGESCLEIDGHFTDGTWVLVGTAFLIFCTVQLAILRLGPQAQ